MNTICIIPARMSSTRLPGKPLLKKQGITLIETVWRQCEQTGFDVAVATDHHEIKHTVESFGGTVIMTDPQTSTGSDRCAEASEGKNYDKVINVQGDMPYITPQQILDCASILDHHDIGTLIYEMSSQEQNNPNSVKCIAVEKQGIFDCRWFGRMAVPYGYHHAGIYAYRHDVLALFRNLAQGKYEQHEKLEQLRWLENDFKIHAVMTTPIQGEINTLQDYELWCD